MLLKPQVVLIHTVSSNKLHILAKYLIHPYLLHLQFIICQREIEEAVGVCVCFLKKKIIIQKQSNQSKITQQRMKFNQGAKRNEVTNRSATMTRKTAGLQQSGPLSQSLPVPAAG